MQEMQEMRVQSPGHEDPLEQEMATNFSILAWKISWTEEPGRLQFTGSQGVGCDRTTEDMHTHTRKLLNITEKMKDLNTWENIPLSMTVILNISRMSILFKQIYRFKAVPIKILVTFFCRIRETFTQFQMNPRKYEQLKNLQKEKQRKMKFEDSHLLICKLLTKLQ